MGRAKKKEWGASLFAPSPPAAAASLGAAFPGAAAASPMSASTPRREAREFLEPAFDDLPMATAGRVGRGEGGERNGRWAQLVFETFVSGADGGPQIGHNFNFQAKYAA